MRLKDVFVALWWAGRMLLAGLGYTKK